MRHKIREWMSESRSLVVPSDNDEARVFLNPSANELRGIVTRSKFAEARLVITPENVYAWDAYYGTHTPVVSQLEPYVDDLSVSHSFAYGYANVEYDESDMQNRMRAEYCYSDGKGMFLYADEPLENFHSFSRIFSGYSAL